MKSELVSKVVKSYMTDYANYVSSTRALANVVDGLKTVQRRILWSLIKNNFTHDKPYKKSAYIVGETMKSHPHGDSSIYGALVKMTNAKYPLVQGRGNWGSYNSTAAAPRYTEIRLSEMCDFYHMDSPLNLMEPTYDNIDVEPLVFISKIPMGLINASAGVGVGIRTLNPSYNFIEIIDFCLDYLDGKENKLLIPDFDNSLITDFDNQGNITISCDYEWTSDGNLLLKSISPNFSIERLYKSLEKFLDNKFIEISDQSYDKEIRILIESKSTKLLKDVVFPKLSSSLTFIRNFSNLPMSLYADQISSALFNQIIAPAVPNWKQYSRPIIEANLKTHFDIWYFTNLCRLAKISENELIEYYEKYWRSVVKSEILFHLKKNNIEWISLDYDVIYSILPIEKLISDITEGMSTFLVKQVIPQELIKQSINSILNTSLGRIKDIRIDEEALEKYNSILSNVYKKEYYDDQIKLFLNDLKSKFSDQTRKTRVLLGHKSEALKDSNNLKMFLVDGTVNVLDDLLTINKLRYDRIYSILDYNPSANIVTESDHKLDNEGIVENNLTISGCVGLITNDTPYVLNITEDNQLVAVKSSYGGVSSKRLVKIKYSIPFKESKYLILNGTTDSYIIPISSIFKSRVPVFYEDFKLESFEIKEVLFAGDQIINVSTSKHHKPKNKVELVTGARLVPTTKLLCVGSRSCEIVESLQNTSKKFNKFINLWS